MVDCYQCQSGGEEKDDDGIVRSRGKGGREGQSGKMSLLLALALRLGAIQCSPSQPGGK